jgi:hypothetical protein
MVHVMNVWMVVAHQMMNFVLLDFGVLMGVVFRKPVGVAT